MVRVSFTTRDGKSFQLNPLGFGAGLWARINTRMDDSSFLRVICVLFLLLYFRDLFVFRYPAAASLGGISLLLTALLFPSILDRPVYWLMLLLPNTWMILKTPYYASNHAFLELYMILTFFIVSRIKEPKDRVRHLQRITKVLLSLTMISAVLHKLLSSSFLNGQFFYFRWLTDILFQRLRGSPLGYRFPASGSPVIDDAIALVKGSRQPQAARAFIDWVGSREAQLLAAEKAFRLPARQDLPPEQLPEWAREALSKLVTAEVDWELIEREGAEWMNLWDRSVRGKG